MTPAEVETELYELLRERGRLSWAELRNAMVVKVPEGRELELYSTMRSALRRMTESGRIKEHTQ